MGSRVIWFPRLTVSPYLVFSMPGVMGLGVAKKGIAIFPGDNNKVFQTCIGNPVLLSDFVNKGPQLQRPRGVAAGMALMATQNATGT